MRSHYETRLRRVIQHIFDNPAGDLSLDALADVAAMSRFQWHRVFHAMTGETCAQAVRRIRAHRAACWLVQTDWPVEVIAARAGYDNPQSFVRLFRTQFGMTPLTFRSTGVVGPLHLSDPKGDPHMFDVDIRTLDPLRLAALPHRGAYPEIGRAFEQVSAIFAAHELWPHARGMVGVYYDDPAAVPEAELKSDAGIVVPTEFALPDSLTEVHLDGGKHAVLTFKGPYAGLPQAYEYLYGTWLPDSGAEPRNAPPFERYLNDPSQVAPSELLTEVCAPLA